MLALKHLASGKVREIYEVDERRLLFVATDRISAYDHVLKPGIPGKGKILSQLSNFWFERFPTRARCSPVSPCTGSTTSTRPTTS